ncbi:MAG: NAD(P)H-binding protein [Acidobacteriaceae bacterium]|nr:NAD(P)H-binding protein [Acidobacteriaceae bacterium]MBV9296451.1 NAD(P)H-binding protein [Acidobacteriaceae bacterium]MBV9764620.1 NAD(P)H-binding protein [Acidobacteriaceae bacterium]
MYVIAGATGQTGSVVAESLLAQGKPITVIARTEEKGQSWRAKGAQVAVGSLEDTVGLTRILANAEGAYFLVPPNYDATDLSATQKLVADSLAKAARESGIPHVVFLSSIAGHLASGTGPIRGLHYAESVLTSLATNVTILRPAYFLENWAPVVPMAATNGILPTFLTPNRKIPMIATKDIGLIAAESLINPTNGVRIVELTGPEDYCPDDIAAILSSILNHEVHAQAVPLSAAASTFTHAGFSESVARLFEEMLAGLNSGHVSFEHEQHEGIEFREGTVNAAEVLKELLGRSERAQAGSA